MLPVSVYNWVVNKGKLADYFEHNWLKYQLDHGRCNQAEMSKALGISQSYFNQLLEGTKTNMNRHAAIFVAGVFNDYEILDILGYEYDQLESMLRIDQLPKEIQSGLREFVSGIETSLKSSNVSKDSPEYDTILKSAIEKFGVTVKVKTTGEPGSEK